MDHHGWEFILFCLVRLWNASVWPAAMVIVAVVFRKQIAAGFEALATKIEGLIEAQLSGLGNLKFKTPEVVNLKDGPGVKSTEIVEDDLKLGRSSVNPSKPDPIAL